MFEDFPIYSNGTKPRALQFSCNLSYTIGIRRVKIRNNCETRRTLFGGFLLFGDAKDWGLSSKRASVYRTLVIREILQDFVRIPFCPLSRQPGAAPRSGRHPRPQPQTRGRTAIRRAGTTRGPRSSLRATTRRFASRRTHLGARHRTCPRRARTYRHYAHHSKLHR